MNTPPSAHPSISAATKIVRSPNLLSTLVGEEVVIFDVEQGRYFSLNAIGASIWQRLEKPVTFAELCDVLALEYDAPRATIEEDVVALLSDMAKNGLVQV